MLEEHETKHEAMQLAITTGFESGVAEGFDMNNLQARLDAE